MNNDLKILITGTLAKSESISEINKKISEIEKNLNKVKLNVDLDPKFIETLKQFNEHVTKYGDNLRNLNREVATITKTYKQADGTLVKLTQRLYENEEISKHESKILTDKNKELNEQIALNKELINQYRERVELQKSSVQYDAQGNFRGQKDTYRDPNKELQVTEKFNEHGEKLVNVTYDIEKAQKNARRELLLTNKSLKNLDNITQETIVTLLKQHNVIKDTEVLGASFNKTTKQWSVTVKDGANQQRTLKGVLDDTTSSLYKTSDATKQAASANLGFIEQLKVALTRVPVWMAAMTAFYGSIRTIQRMTNVIVEVDSAMTDLRKVMDEASTDFNQMLDDSIQKAKNLGQTVTDVLDSFTQAAKAGLSQEEIGFLSEASLIASNVGEMEAAEASEYLISAIEQMNLTYQDSMSIIDQWNNISNKNATTVKDLAEGWARSASTVRNFGGDVHELNAAIGALTQVTRQSGNEIGNFLKSTAPRLMSSEVEDTLANIGIHVKNANGELRGMFDIYRDIAKALDEGRITQEEFNEAALALGGRYHITRVQALIESMRELNGEQSLFDKILNESMNSAGSALQENETYMESLEAKQKQLIASFQELSIVAGKSAIEPVYRSLLETLTSLTNVATGIVDKFGLLPPVFGTIAGIVMLFSRRLRDLGTYTGIYQAIVDTLRTKMSNLVTAFRITTEEVRKQTVAMSGLAKVAKGTSTAVSTFKTLFSGLVGGIAITAASIAIGKLVEKYIELNEQQKQFQENVEKSTIALQHNREHISNLVDEYEKLSNIDRNLDQEERYIQLQNELAELLPVLVAGTDEHGNSILVKSDLVKTYVEHLERQLELERDIARQTAGQTIKENRKNLSESEKGLENLEKQLERLKGLYDTYISKGMDEAADRVYGQMATIQQEMMNTLMDQSTYIENIQQAYEAWVSTVNGITEGEISWIAQLGMDANMTEQEVQGLAEQVLRLKDLFPQDFSFTGFSYEQLNVIQEVTDSVRKGIYTWEEHSRQLLQTGLDAEQVGQILGHLRYTENQLEQAARDNGLTIEEFNPVFNEYGEIADWVSKELNETTDSADELNTAVEQQLKTFNNALSSIKSLNGVINELNEGNGISVDTLTMLLENYPHLLAYINDETALRKAVQQEIANQTKIAKQAAYERLMADENYIKTSQVLHSDFAKWLKDTYGIDLANYKNLAKAKADVDRQLVNQLGQFWRSYFKVSADGYYQLSDGLVRAALWSPEAAKRADQAKAIADQLNKAAEGFKNITLGSLKLPDFSSYGIQKPKSSKNKKSSAAKEREIEREIERYETDKYAQALEELNLKLAESEARLNDYSKTSQKYRNELKHQIKLYKEQIKLSNDEIKRLEKRNKTLQNQLKSMGNFNKLSNKNKEKYNEIAREIDDNIKKINQLKRTSLDASEAIEDANEKIRESYEEIADEVIDLYKEIIEVQRDQAIKALEDELKQLERTHRRKMQLLDEELASYQEKINKQKESLQLQKDEEDWNKTIQERQEELLKLQEQYNIWSRDDSLTGRNRARELRKEIEELQEEIEELMSDRQYELQQRSLDKLLEDKRKQIEAEKETQEQIYETNRDNLERQRKELERFYENLLNDERAFNEMRNQILADNVNSIMNQMKEFSKYIQINMRTIGESISENLIDKLADAISLLNGISGAFSSGGSARNLNDFLSQLKKNGFAKGGYVSRDGITFVHGGERVLNREDNKNFERMMKLIESSKQWINPIIKTPQLPKFALQGGNSINISMPIHIENMNGTRQDAENVFNIVNNKLTQMGILRQFKG